jgi:hypothetical protein
VAQLSHQALLPAEAGKVLHAFPCASMTKMTKMTGMITSVDELPIFFLYGALGFLCTGSWFSWSPWALMDGQA